MKILLLVLCLYQLCIPTLLAGTIPRHQRVIWTQDPAHEAGISWTTDDPGKESVVYLDTQARKGDLSLYRWKLQSQRDGRFKRSLFSFSTPHFHHIKIASLLPSTNYYFVVATDGKASKEYWFKTAPEREQPVQLLFGGDSRSDDNQRIRMNILMREQLTANGDILALVHGGDYVMSGSRWSDWEAWLSQHSSFTSTESGRVLPIVPTRGNHEGDEELYNQIWNWPGSGLNYFNAHIGMLDILVLNTEVSAFGDQRTWLEGELRKSKAAYVVANYHRPAFPAVKTPSSAKAAWVPLFEQYQIDLAFESDGHVYKQTVPIYKDRLDQERGIIYVGEGGLGVRQRTPDHDRWYLEYPGYATSAHHFQVLKVDAGSLQYVGIGENNELLSTLTRNPKPRSGSIVTR